MLLFFHYCESNVIYFKAKRPYEYVCRHETANLTMNEFNIDNRYKTHFKPSQNGRDPF